jgi:hypothetical protein
LISYPSAEEREAVLANRQEVLGGTPPPGLGVYGTIGWSLE